MKTVLSPSAITLYKQCPYAYYLQYIYGLRPAEDADALRIGTNWHEVARILDLKPNQICPDCGPKSEPNYECPFCCGGDEIPEDLIEAVISFLDKAYADKTVHDSDKFELERTRLLYAAIAYQWYYSELDTYKTLAHELHIDAPVGNGVYVHGYIDRVMQGLDGKLYIGERKTTSKDIAPGAEYWEPLKVAVQPRTYLYALKYAKDNGILERSHGITPDMEIGGIIYDVHKKPGIKPKKPVKKDIEELSGYPLNYNYYGTQFQQSEIDSDHETYDMYGARLLHEFTENPEKYFQMQEVPIFEKDLPDYAEQARMIGSELNFRRDNDCWYKNENQCNAIYKCRYFPICYNGAELTEDTVPEGFIRRSK